jgi:phytoene/squalene synthetase
MRAVPVDHYENFPVASLLCPPSMRAGVTALYHFARTADDIADEGDARPRPAGSNCGSTRPRWRRPPQAEPAAGPWAPVFGPLAQAIGPVPAAVATADRPARRLLQDTHNPRYADRAQLLDYCRRSANPVGRLMLHMAGVQGAQALAQSDAICSALQLINFWQDPSVDLPRGRLLRARGRRPPPRADAGPAGQQPDEPTHSQALLRELCHWAGALMTRRRPAGLRRAGARLGWELRLVVQGGLRILETIAAMHYRDPAPAPQAGRP